MIITINIYLENSLKFLKNSLKKSMTPYLNSLKIPYTYKVISIEVSNVIKFLI